MPGPRVRGLNVDVENCEVGGRVSKLVATILPYSNLAIIVCFYDLVRHSKKALTFSLDP